MKHRRNRGVAAIEAALVLFGTSALLVIVLNCGRLALAGAALDRGASNAARYLAIIPVEDLQDSARRSVALAAAQSIVDEALAGASIDAQALRVEFTCDPGECSLLQSSDKPSRVGVLARLAFNSELIGSDVQTQLVAYAEVGRDN